MAGTDPNSTVSFSYDANFWLKQISGGGATVNYGYDNDGLLTSASLGSTTLSLSRNSQNGLLQGTSIGSLTDSWAFNGFAEPTGYSVRYGGTELLATSFGRDELGRITSLRETRAGVALQAAYGYDAAGRLQTVTHDGAPVSRYGFDSNSNRTEHRIGAASKLRGKAWPCLGDLSGSTEKVISGQYDAQDRMTGYGSCTYEYTANGELTRRIDTATNTVTRYRYDVFGNLREAWLPDGRQVTYTIDAQNRRIGKAIDGTRVQGFLYLNQLEPIAELDGNGNIVASFVYADRSNTPSLMLKGGKTYRIIADHLGSVRLVVDIATGEVAQRMSYDEFGNVVEDTNPGFQPFSYAGGIYDRDTGLVRFGARDYDPLTGRWTAKDLKGFTDGTNRYAYARLEPINRYDLNGLESEIIFWSPLASPGSMFGHVSANIDGENFSFGPNGWDQQRPQASDYASRQEELGRTGVGHKLDLTGDQESQFKKCMTSIKRRQTSDDYNAILNNCTTGAQLCLLQAGVELPEMSIFPASFQQQLGGSEVVGGINWYSPR